MTFLTLDQIGSLGKKCSHCDKYATWIYSNMMPAYCDEHFPYWEFKKKESDLMLKDCMNQHQC